jgi:DNA modification methylase
MGGPGVHDGRNAHGKPGGVVLDPFCGSGSTLVAARDVGCAYLGIELDATHHRTAVERLHGGTLEPVDALDVMPWARPFTRYVEALA